MHIKFGKFFLPFFCYSLYYMTGFELPIFNLHIYFFDIVQGVTNKSFSCDEEGHNIYYNVMQHIPSLSQRTYKIS